jgi:hypothetical protein
LAASRLGRRPFDYVFGIDFERRRPKLCSTQ